MTGLNSFIRSYALFEQTGNEWGIALVLNLLGWKAFMSMATRQTVRRLLV
jgi:hypothetical protein